MECVIDGCPFSGCPKGRSAARFSNTAKTVLWGTAPGLPLGEELAEAILGPAFGGQDGDEEVEEDEAPVVAVLEDDEEDAEALAAEAEDGAGVPAAEVEAEAEAPAAEARAEEPMAEVAAAVSRFMALRIVYGGRMPKK